MLTIAMTVGLVSGAAYALFSDTATISGVTMATGNADLKISGDTETTGYDDNFVFPAGFNTNISAIFPGFEDYANLWLKNDSDSHIKLDVTARLTSAGGDWGTLKDVLQIKVIADSKDGASTGWKTLAEWNADGGVYFPGDDIDQGAFRKYYVYFRVPSTATNTIADKALSNVTFVLTATQVNY